MGDEHEDFVRVPHTGGKVTFHFKDEGGRRSHSTQYEHQNPTAAAFFAVWAMVPEGLVVDTITMGGIGDPWSMPPMQPCVEVFIASDREGLFGRSCPSCERYFRTTAVPSPRPTVCPYCKHEDHTHLFFTEEQARYVRAYVQRFVEAYNAGETSSIDIDALAVETSANVPPLYYAEEKQQTQFSCPNCRCRTDISGLYGYCPLCSRRNSILVLESHLGALEERVVRPRYDEKQRELRDAEWREVVKQCVSYFEGFAVDLLGELAKELMTPIRRRKIQEVSFHRPISAAESLQNLFGIDLLVGIDNSQREFIRLRFLRRHVYEHKSGVADAEYVNESGDKPVQVGHRIRESSSNAGTIIRLVRQMAQNFHEGFHSRTRA